MLLYHTSMWRKYVSASCEMLQGDGFENVQRLQREHIMRENNFYLGSSFIPRCCCPERENMPRAKRSSVGVCSAIMEPSPFPNDAL